MKFSPRNGLDNRSISRSTRWGEIGGTQGENS